jgi:hypothetical protein
MRERGVTNPWVGEGKISACGLAAVAEKETRGGSREFEEVRAKHSDPNGLIALLTSSLSNNVKIKYRSLFGDANIVGL